MLGFLNIMLVDAHCHVHEIKNFTLDNEVLPITCGYSHSSNIKTLEVAKRFSIPFVLGIAPQTALREDLSKLDEWISLIKKNKPLAIGEIGLDFHWARDKNDVEKEKGVFIEMLGVAESMKLPVVIHSRDATIDAIKILEEYDLLDKAMFHFFSGSIKEAEIAVASGAMLSFPPLPSKERRNIIKRTELENILVETDAPFVCRSQNEVVKAVAYVAEIKKLDYEIVSKQITKNAINFFNITNLKLL
jgi:TatD DNase family protein